MIEKLLAAEYLPIDGQHTHVIRKKHTAPNQTELWMVFSGTTEYGELATEIWENLERAYFVDDNTAKNPYDRFEEALKEVNASLNENEMVHSAEFYRSNSIILALFAQGTLHITVVGNGEVYLVRKAKFTPISEGLTPKKFEGDVFVNIASGDLEADDTVVLSSERLLRYATAHQLADMLEDQLENVQESLRELLQMADSEASFVVLRAEKAKETLPFAAEPDLPTARKHKKGGFGFAPLENFSWANVVTFSQDFLKKLRRGEQKTFLAAVLGVLGLLVIIILFLSFSGSSGGSDYESYKELLGQVQVNLKNVENQEVLGQNEEANANLSKVERDLEKILASTYFRSEANALFTQMSQIKDRINKITRISTPKTMANLKTRKSDVVAKGVFAYDTEWYAFDSQSLFRIVLDGVENMIALLPQANVTAGVPLEKKQKMVFFDPSGKVVEYDAESNAVAFAKTEDETWKKAVNIASFGDNIYFLAPDEKQIWKYERSSDNFSRAIPYLQEDYADMADAISLAVDGDIFVLTNGGKLLKFFKGVEQEYEITGAPAEVFDGATQIFTSAELEHILVLNPKHSTVYVFFKGAKQAEYVSQIVFENVGTLQSMWVKAPHKLVVADSGAVYGTVDF